MSLPPSSRLRFADDLTICRILNGMWQVSGAHGRIDALRAVEEMFAYHDAGFTTWDLADHYGAGIGNVGTRYVLNRPAVAGVIVGARLGLSQHIEDNARTFGFTLDADDLARIEAVLDRSRDLMALIGDCGDEYR